MAISKEERAQLKQLPIRGYCDWKGIPYTTDSASELRMVDHDSLVVRTKLNRFVWNSTGIKGDLVDFIHYYELGKNEGDSKGLAIKNQLAYARYIKGENIDVNKIYESQQPRYKFDYDKVFKTEETNVAKDYLVNQRQLDPQFVDNLLRSGSVVQGSRYREDDKLHQNPVIFPWKDVTGKIVGADRQGTEQDFEHFKKRGTSKKIFAGSDTSTGYNISFGTGDQTLVLFESPIDLLSYAQQNHQELQKNNATLLSVSGTDAKRGVQYLNDAVAAKQAKFNHISVAFDNDKAGFKAADFFARFSFKNPITDEPITVTRQIPVQGKDWNEQLKAGVTGYRELSIADNAKRLDALEKIAVQETQTENAKMPDEKMSSVQPVTAAPAKKDVKQNKGQQTKADRRKENALKNKRLIQEAIGKVSKYQQDPAELKKLLDFTATGLNYSARNSMLIQLQNPAATLLKGYKQWAADGIQVNKGEKGIKIFGAPANLKTIIEKNGEKIRWADATPEQKQLANNKDLEVRSIKYYPVETVFDVRQTNATAEQLPSLLPNRPIDLATDKSPEHLDTAYKTLLRFADQLKVPVIDQGVDNQIAKRPMTWQGQAKGAFVQSKVNSDEKYILMRSDLTPTDKIHTLAHEIAHAQLHSLQSQNNWSTEIKETQAELSSYVITKNLGIDPGEKSVNYLAGWSNNLKALEGQNVGKIISQALKASTDVTQYFSDNLSQGEIRQPKTTKLLKPDKLAVVEQNYQAINNSHTRHM
ncbi:ArdC-like ssDNA-binding domain-containing protein [Leuconostoc citreum]